MSACVRLCGITSRRNFATLQLCQAESYSAREVAPRLFRPFLCMIRVISDYYTLLLSRDQTQH